MSFQIHTDEDSQEEIKMCLNCKKATCTNCIEHVHKKNPSVASADKREIPFLRLAIINGPASPYGMAAIYKLWSFGYGDPEIAEVLKSLRETIYQSRKRMGIISIKGCHTKEKRERWVVDWLLSNPDVKERLDKMYEGVNNSDPEYVSASSLEFDDNVEIKFMDKILSTSSTDQYFLTAVFILWKNGYSDRAMSVKLGCTVRQISAARWAAGFDVPIRNMSRNARIEESNKILDRDPDLKCFWNEMEMKLQGGEEP